MESMVNPVLAANKDRRILVTGAEGYIGCILTARLIEAGFAVDGLDAGFYENGWLFHDGRDRPGVRVRDTRRVSPDDLAGYDTVVHLAELSNDPLCELNEDLSFDVNHRGSVALARKAKEAGVKRFVYASSCSVYGAAGAEEKIETSEPNPQTAYARCKVLSERDITSLADDSFSPVFLRNATAFGASPRMRFDIVLNNLAGIAWTTKCIKMTSDGTPWRPLVHVEDISTAVICAIEAPTDAIHSQIFNVGSDEQNYRIREIAETVGETFPGCTVEIGSSVGDNRSYRVSFEKIRSKLPGFSCRWNVRAGAEQLRRVFETIGMTEAVFNAAPFTRLKQLRHLVQTQQVDSNLYWRTA